MVAEVASVASASVLVAVAWLPCVVRTGWGDGPVLIWCGVSDYSGGRLDLGHTEEGSSFHCCNYLHSSCSSEMQHIIIIEFLADFSF